MSRKAGADDASHAGLIYTESISSARTAALFVALTLLFFLLSAWRLSAGGLDALAALSLGLGAIFLFYSVNYKTLVIRLTPEALKLKFGIFRWTEPTTNIAACRLDELPTVLRLGGAGIHFMFVRGRYRASFNFLEYPRVVITLRKNTGPVRDISFSTRQPEDILRLMRAAAQGAAKPEHGN